METVWKLFQDFFGSLGLTTPLSRFAAMTALGAAAEYTIRPSYSYFQNGAPRPWAPLNPENSDKTWLPAGSTALATGAFFGVFV